MTALSRSVSLGLAFAASLAIIRAQSLAPAGDVERIPGAYRVPIHGVGPDPTAPQELWTSGDDFKASFHDGFAFHPVLGASYPENLPLVWRTRELRAGGRVVVRAEHPRRPDWTATRCEFAHDRVVEAYDVRDDGIEQTFTIAAPLGDGDLEIVGDLRTALRAATRAPKHGELIFCGPRGEKLVHYGAATAIDASGRRSPVASGFDGEAIVLVVDGGWLADAAYPVVVDPLFGRAVIGISPAGAGAGAIRDTYRGAGLRFDVGHESRRASAVASTMYAWSRLYSATDADVYVRLCNDDLTASTLVYSEVSTAWSIHPRLTFLGGLGALGSWVIAHDYATIPTALSEIRYHVHAAGDTTFSATYTVLPTPASVSAVSPDVGGTGSAGGTTALFVCQLEYSGGAASDVYGVLVDFAVPSETPVALAPFSAGSDREWPVATQYSEGGSWIVAWQQYDAGSPDWDIDVVRVSPGGVVTPVAELGDNDDRVHSLHPQVAGSRGRFFMTYTKRADAPMTKYPYLDGPIIEGERFDWAEGAMAPVRDLHAAAPHFVSGRTILDEAGVMPNPPGTILNCSCAYDTISDSHWVGCYTFDPTSTTLRSEVRAARVGFRGKLLERTTVWSSTIADGFSATCTFDDANQRFPLGFFTTEATPYLDPAYGEILLHPARARAAYGLGCGAGVIAASDPLIGHEYFGIELYFGGPPLSASSGAVLVSFGPAAIPLDPVGVTGCTLLVDPGPPFVGSFGATILGGFARIPIALIETVPSADLYWQWVYPDAPSGRPLPVSLTRGLRTSIR
ncbi:MAG: hypothetical protein HZB39_00195 [Planctomycetes bacterium]|nr:hypothetical protein [Planctomycetota bacterium]